MEGINEKLSSVYEDYLEAGFMMKGISDMISMMRLNSDMFRDDALYTLEHILLIMNDKMLSATDTLDTVRTAVRKMNEQIKAAQQEKN